LQGQISEISIQKYYLDQEIEITDQEIDNVTAMLDVIDQQIAEKEIEYNQVLEDEANQVEIFKKRVRAMEENSDISYYSILFQARDFSDLLNRMDIISEIMSYDEQVVNRLEAAKERSAKTKAELEDIQVEWEAYRAIQEDKKAQKAEELAAAETLMQEYEAAREEQEDLFDQYNAERDKVDADIAATAKKIAEEEAKAKAAENAERLKKINSTGTYMWPSDTTRITDTFGYRAVHPVTGKKGAMHAGVDIGAPSGSNIYAADSGEVVTATYSSSYGNYVMIYHGNGRYTVYAHMSKLKCKKGDYVKKGAVIGLVGSTGISTGPHLHFETREDGVAVDPMKYFK
jgi:murein DD-endopeptidase MepM/ murein hydrolase activator NlpD